jgi:hypothetical protein
VENITRTIYGSALQTYLLTGRTFSRKANSTLNEKFNIQKDTLPNSTSTPTLGYYAIGNGGHTWSAGAGGIGKPDPLQHIATDAANFNHIPFVLRTLDNDLTALERARYALRRIETIDGVQYAAYYLKRIDYTGVTVDMQLKTIANGVTTVSTFTPDSSNLNPTPQQLSSTGVNSTDGTYACATAKIDLSLDQDDCTELLNVAKIKYGDDSYAIISEVGLVSGVDQMVQASGQGNSTFQFNEAIAAQLISFINAFYPVKYLNTGIDIVLDVGATEPLFKLVAA